MRAATSGASSCHEEEALRMEFMHNNGKITGSSNIAVISNADGMNDNSDGRASVAFGHSNFCCQLLYCLILPMLMVTLLKGGQLGIAFVNPGPVHRHCCTQILIC